MNTFICNYRQTQLQELFKKDLVAIRKFLTPANIVNIVPGVMNDYAVHNNAKIHFFSHSPLGRYTYIAPENLRKVSYTFDFGIHTMQINNIHFRIQNFHVAEMLNESPEISISQFMRALAGGTSKCSEKLLFNFTNIHEYTLDKILYVKIKEKRIDNHKLNVLLKGYLEKYGERKDINDTDRATNYFNSRTTYS